LVTSALGPLVGNFSSSNLLKGAEKDHVVTEVIRAAAVGSIPWGSPTVWTQVAGKEKAEKLGTSIPTVFQRSILGNFLNAVRIRSDNKDGVLHTTKLEKDIIKYMNLLT
jgi:hypothetical protein